MKTEEKLSRAGWLFKEESKKVDLYTRNEYIILYDKEKDEVLSFCKTGDNTLLTPDDIQLEIFFEK